MRWFVPVRSVVMTLTMARPQWGDEMEMFSYFATDKVDDWWTKWGSLLARDTGRPEVPVTPTVEVSVSSGQYRSTFVY